jgi:hypothetical protein
MWLSVSYSVRGSISGNPVMRRTARLRRPPRLSDLFAPSAITCLCTIGWSVFCKIGAVPARLEHLLTAAAAKI